MKYNNPLQDFWVDATKDWTPDQFRLFLQWLWANGYKPTSRQAKRFAQNNFSLDSL